MALPALAWKTNSGKGVPLRFHFVHLDSVRQMFKKGAEVKTLYEGINEDSIKKVVQLSIQMSETRMKLCDLQADINKKKEFVADDIVAQMNTLTDKFLAAEATFKCNLKEVLSDIRSTTKDVSDLDTLAAELTKTGFSPSAMAKEVNKFSSVLNKLKDVQEEVSQEVMEMFQLKFQLF